jgi:hypothetical protein
MSDIMTNEHNEYRDHTKLQPLVAEIRWVNNLVIFTRSEDELDRENAK